MKLDAALANRKHEKTKTLLPDAAATLRDLAQMAARAEFRSDLYYRLNVFPVLIPPLRERGEDISQFVEHFVEVLLQAHGEAH